MGIKVYHVANKRQTVHEFQVISNFTRRPGPHTQRPGDGDKIRVIGIYWEPGSVHNVLGFLFEPMTVHEALLEAAFMALERARIVASTQPSPEPIRRRLFTAAPSLVHAMRLYFGNCTQLGLNAPLGMGSDAGSCTRRMYEVLERWKPPASRPAFEIIKVSPHAIKGVEDLSVGAIDYEVEGRFDADPRAWIVTRLINRHVCNQWKRFATYESLFVPVQMDTQGGRTDLWAIGKGTVRLSLHMPLGEPRTHEFLDVLHVPQAAYSVLSAVDLPQWRFGHDGLFDLKGVRTVWAPLLSGLNVAQVAGAPDSANASGVALQNLMTSADPRHVVGEYQLQWDHVLRALGGTTMGAGGSGMEYLGPPEATEGVRRVDLL